MAAAVRHRAFTCAPIRRRTCATALARAFAHFASQRPRPAYLEIPLDLLKEPAGDGWQRAAPAAPRPAAGRPDRCTPSTRLSSAQRAAHHPRRRRARWRGGGAGDRREARRRRSSPPPPARVRCRKIIPLCLGYRLGLDGAPAFIRSADAILCAGSQLSETDFWSEDGDRGEPDPHRHRPRFAREARTRRRSPSMPMPAPHSKPSPKGFRSRRATAAARSRSSARMKSTQSSRMRTAGCSRPCWR